MKMTLQRHGRTIGGVCGIATAIAFLSDHKTLGLALAFCALVAVITAERLKK